MTAPTYLHYRMTLHSPAIVSTLSGDPNSAATQSFIPGSAIRGAVAARLLSNGTRGDSEDFRKLILSGEVRYPARLSYSGRRSRVARARLVEEFEAQHQPRV